MASGKRGLGDEERAKDQEPSPAVSSVCFCRLVSTWRDSGQGQTQATGTGQQVVIVDTFDK